MEMGNDREAEMVVKTEWPAAHLDGPSVCVVDLTRSAKPAPMP
jgi:hypothetical protein